MTLVWNPTVSITLDTRPPVLAVTSDGQVQTPDQWSVTISSNEVIGGYSLGFIDSLGIEHPVGAQSLDDRTLSVEVPTDEIASGPGYLSGWVDDLVLNRAQVRQPVVIQRQAPFDVMMTVGHAFSAEVVMADGFEAALGFGRAFDTDEEQAHAFDTEMDVERGFSAELEVDNAG